MVRLQQARNMLPSVPQIAVPELETYPEDLDTFPSSVLLLSLAP